MNGFDGEIDPILRFDDAASMCVGRFDHIVRGHSMTKRQITVALLLLGSASTLQAQNELQLRQQLEGKRVVLQIDMPATSDGVDIHPGSSRPIDFGKYSGRLKDNGVAIRTGESSMITKVKVKDELIEIHLGGGGFGTVGDALGSLFGSTGADSGVAQQAKIANEREQRLASGSRFNLRYPNGLTPDDVTAESVIAALQEYASIAIPRQHEPAIATESTAHSSASPPASPQTTSDVVGTPSPSKPSTPSLPRKGMSPEDVERLAGRPTSSKTEGQIVTNTYAWPDGELEADYYNGVLVAYRIQSR